LSLAHVPNLCEVGLDPELWRVTSTNITIAVEMAAYVQAALETQAAGTALPFATILAAENRVIGSTRFANYDRGNRRVEIGWTWIAPPWQRSGANVEAKLLMLGHAFDVLGCNRVEFKTDALNDKSRSALLGIGAQEEGTLRRHMVLWNGRIRDSVYFSVIREEWPQVRAHLEGRLKS
jgi:RimJ/RimL family protein N-acetyltransferase